MNLRTQLLALGFVLILASATAYYWYTSDQEPQSNEEQPDPKITADISSEFNLLEGVVYEGQSYAAQISITTNTTVTLHNLSLTMYDGRYDRLGSQIHDLSANISEGTTTFDLEISPSFPELEGAVISEVYEQYTLESYLFHYNTSDIVANQTGTISETLEIIPSPLYDQSSTLEWNITPNANIEVHTGENVTLGSDTSETLKMQTNVNTTGYTRISINQTLTNSSVSYLLDSEVVNLVDDKYLPIGNIEGLVNFTVIGEIGENGSISLSFSIPTKRVVLFAVVADDNWRAESDESFEFRDPSFYISQMSDRFEDTLNVSIIPAINIPIPKAQSSNLFDLGEQARLHVGSALGLANDTWKFGPGTFEDNVGYDILLIFTNNTMSNLGIVLGNSNSPFNMAIHARGSLNTGNYRLPPSFTDNLVQHEVSHVFGAPDRFTSTSDPSVMTKSLPDDAVEDLLEGNFWLYQTNWLEEDIQTMIDHTIVVYW